MRKVPFNRRKKPVRAGGGMHEFPVGAWDIPAPETAIAFHLKGHDVDREPVVMRTLPSPRFRGPLFEEVVLPSGIAETLEQLEAALREAGLISAGQFVKQRHKDFASFRVYQSDLSVRSRKRNNGHN